MVLDERLNKLSDAQLISNHKQTLSDRFNGLLNFIMHSESRWIPTPPAEWAGFVGMTLEYFFWLPAKSY